MKSCSKPTWEKWTGNRNSGIYWPENGKRWQKSIVMKKGINLFIGHFFFVKEGQTPEAEPESERPILHVGGTQALYTHHIPNQIQYAALGHLHRYHAVGKNHFR
jgi:DNA repair exonuclease SbcCD nuclease subunit